LKEKDASHDNIERPHHNKSNYFESIENGLKEAGLEANFYGKFLQLKKHFYLLSIIWNTFKKGRSIVTPPKPPVRAISSSHGLNQTISPPVV